MFFPDADDVFVRVGEGPADGFEVQVKFAHHARGRQHPPQPQDARRCHVHQEPAVRHQHLDTRLFLL